MKITSVQNQNTTCRLDYGKGKQIQKNQPRFKGSASPFISFWDSVERGGFAATFMMQDVLGSCLPRTQQALHRNEDITGKKNYMAATETALREFITGPSMVAIPMFVLALSKKIGGSANDVPMEHIAPFSDVMKTVLKNPATETAPKEAFYQKMFSLSLGENVKNGVSDTAKELASDLIKYDTAKKRNFFQKLLNKDIIKNGTKIEAKDQIADKILKTYTDARKLADSNHTDIMITNLNGIIKKPKKITSLIKDFSNFGCDVQKTMTKSINGAAPSAHLDYSSFMDHFKNVRTGSKFVTNLLMVAATAIFMTQIPKLYSISKTNPDTDAFRNEGGEVVRANK